MRSQRIGQLVLITLLTAVSTPRTGNLLALFYAPPALAQTGDARKAEADRWIKQAEEQWRGSDYKAAMQSYQQALTLYRQLQDRDGEKEATGMLRDLADRLLEFASFQTNSLQFEAALKSWEQALSLYRQLQDPKEEAELLEIDRHGEGIALQKLGDAYLSFGNPEKAIECLQPALNLARELKESLNQYFVLEKLGDAYFKLGELPKAFEYYQQSFALVKKYKDRGLAAKALSNMADVYRIQKNYPKAIDLYQRSFDLLKEPSAFSGIEAGALSGLGLVYEALGANIRAIDYYQQSLESDAAVQSQDFLLSRFGSALYRSGKLTEAESALLDSIDSWEVIRGGVGNDDANQVSSFEEQANTYRTLQQVLIAQNKTDAALEIAERGRARAFVELLSKRVSSLPSYDCKTVKFTLVCRPTNLPTIAQIKQIAKEQKSTIIEYSIIYDRFQVQKQLQTKESKLYIWVVKPTGEVVLRRGDLKPLWQQQNTTLEDLVSSTRESICGNQCRGMAATARQETNQPKGLQQLHQLLIQPIADLLPKDPNDRVIFVPQSELFLVPFPALQDAEGKYLIEKHTIFTAPSIQVLDLTHKQRRNVSGKEALVVGNPTMPSIPGKNGQPPQQLPTLPGAEGEAKAIAQLLNTKAITGKDATKVSLLQEFPKARLIHLATHGLLDDFQGWGVPGAVALAPTPLDNGLLTASEILDLKLSAELVVLSACDTGKGKITGDGVIGLSRSLISAGVSSVIVSLWSVPDAPTESLMTEFYRNFQQKPDKAQALRLAMLKTMQQNPNPRDWAAFTLIGEAE